VDTSLGDALGFIVSGFIPMITCQPARPNCILCHLVPVDTPMIVTSKDSTRSASTIKPGWPKNALAGTEWRCTERLLRLDLLPRFC
jgi:hypothetical protein